MKEPILRTQDLSIGYFSGRRKRTVVAQDISISLNAGETTCVIGPNGVGKSTLLRTLAGLQPPLGGYIHIEDRELSTLQPKELAQSIGIVLTEQVHVGMLSSFALVGLGRHPYTNWAGKLKHRDIQVVRWALEAVGAQDLAARNVGELSDGERQKVMIARALAQEPHVIILDEPTAFLDLPRRVEIMILLQSLARETGRAILLSTHDLDLALRCADVIWLFSANGRLKAGAPEDLVLSGALEAAFKNRGVIFDRQQGSFIITRRSKGPAGLVGDGLELLWTKRALEREGYDVKGGSRGESISIEVIHEGSAPAWRLTAGGRTSTHSSVYGLIKSLRSPSQGGSPRTPKETDDLDRSQHRRG